MARNRIPFNSGSTPPITGPNYMNNIRDRISDLWDVSNIPLTTIAGTANAITAVCDPALISGVTTGMKFSFIAAATNTTGVTIALNGGSPINLRDDIGAALIAGQIVSGRLYTMEFDGTNLRVQGTSGAVVTNNYQVFTASGTWTKPAGCPANALVTVLAWSGGGGGGTGTTGGISGGGGGGYVAFTCKAGDLSGTVAVTVGAGGVPGNAGGTSSFGTLVTVFGGGAGRGGNNGTVGGGGGGAIQAGGNGTGINGGANAPVALPGDITGGTASALGNVGSPAPTSPQSTWGYFGGGAGGGMYNSGTSEPGGKSVYGGGGGSSRVGTGGGTSQFGGAGGANLAVGQAPGGGGGATANGARGEVRVYVNG